MSCNQGLVRVVLLVVGMALTGYAAPAEGGAGEIAVYGGGLHLGDGGGNHALVGGSVGANLSNRFQLFGEANYSPLASAGSASVKLINFGGGAMINLVPAGAKAVPYISAIGGAGRTSVSGSGASGSSTSAYAGGGLGVRLMAGEHWGVRPEVRYQHYMQNGGGNALQFMAGLFYQFGK